MLPRVFAVVGLLCVLAPCWGDESVLANSKVQLGPRPFYLLDKMSDGALKEELTRCAATVDTYEHSDFSIGHRGAPLQFPEHTRESYLAARRMGAGVLECDVTFTKDGQLVCRHSQCDLHSTTNVLTTPLASTCREAFTPAKFAADGKLVSAATARCCTSDLTLAEFKALEGRMDVVDPQATTVAEFLGGETDVRSGPYGTGGSLVTHTESIALFDTLGAKFAPELKAATDGFGASGLDQETYARKLISEYVDAGIHPDRVLAQSFDLDDVEFWIKEFPRFGKRSVYLDGRKPTVLSANPPPLSEFDALKLKGVNIVAPPMPALLKTDANDNIVPSGYGENARRAGLEIVTWTTERSGRIVEDVLVGGNDFYYRTTLDALENDGDILRTIHVLAQDVMVIGIFSDWPATTTFYANCFSTTLKRSD